MKSATTTRRILQIGPAPTATGGMASVLGQIMALDFSDDYEQFVLPFTEAPDIAENVARKSLRHVGQLQTLRRRLLEDEIDLVHIHTCSGMTFFRCLADVKVAKRLGVPVVLHIHGASFDKFFDTSGSVRRRLIRYGLRAPDSLIALSTSWHRKIARMAEGQRIHVVENAVDLPFMSPDRPFDEGGTCRFVLLAKMDVWKGIDDLLSAAEKLRRMNQPFQLKLAGPPGSAGDAIQINRKIVDKRLSDTVEYVGTVKGKAKHDLLVRADVYVQPSHHEGMPISLLEALAYGLPVIATKVGAIPEVIEDGAMGLLTSARDPDALASAMRLASEDVSLRRRLGAAGRVLAETRFSLFRFREDLRSIYDEVLAECEPSRTDFQVHASAV